MFQEMLIDAWDVLNAQVIFQSTDAPWYLKIWGQNLMDDDNITGHYFTLIHRQVNLEMTFLWIQE